MDLNSKFENSLELAKEMIEKDKLFLYEKVIYLTKPKQEDACEIAFDRRAYGNKIFKQIESLIEAHCHTCNIELEKDLEEVINKNKIISFIVMNMKMLALLSIKRNDARGSMSIVVDRTKVEIIFDYSIKKSLVSEFEQKHTLLNKEVKEFSHYSLEKIPSKLGRNYTMIRMKGLTLIDMIKYTKKPKRKIEATL